MESLSPAVRAISCQPRAHLIIETLIGSRRHLLSGGGHTDRYFIEIVLRQENLPFHHVTWLT